MKRILSFLTVSSMVLAANASNYNFQDKDYRDWGKLKLVGNQLSSSNGDPVQLKGWSADHILSHDVDGCLGQGQFKMMKNYGANVVRLPLNVSDTLKCRTYLSNMDLSKNMIKMFISEAYDERIYVVVTWDDSDNNGNGTFDLGKSQKEAKDFFAEISKYCADNGYDNVLYELCNEPTCGWTEIKKYAEDVIPVITANQSDALIIVDTDQWSLKIMDPVAIPVDSTYKKNVMYSFHYYACSHYNFLADFRSAQKNIPVFVSEWSAVKFDREGPFCRFYSDALMSACEYQVPIAPQVVSWCIWNWGTKDDDASSFFTGACAPGFESQYESLDSSDDYGHYLRELMAGGIHPCCPPVPEPNPYDMINVIPTSPDSLWRWNYYNVGGESYAYHDNNSDAWKYDEEGVVLDYSKEFEEVDVFSLAYKMQWLNKECPWSTVKDGKIVSWDESINTTWGMEEGLSTYKSLNGGRNYFGANDTIRPDEGVDLVMANCKGTPYEGAGYTNLGWVEDGEWIEYTVNVKTPGYYKISGVVTSEYKAREMGGEISIISNEGDNLLRGANSVTDAERVTTFGFKKTVKCADPNAESIKPWDCWAISDAINGKENVYCAFAKAGIQKIRFQFNGDAGGVGPLSFDFVRGLAPEDVFIDDENDVNNVNADLIKFTITPNPTSGEFSVSLADGTNATVEVVNMAGQVVASQIVDGTATIDKTLSPGVYTVVVKSEGAVGTQKLIVK